MLKHFYVTENRNYNCLPDSKNIQWESLRFDICRETSVICIDDNLADLQHTLGNTLVLTSYVTLLFLLKQMDTTMQCSTLESVTLGVGKDKTIALVLKERVACQPTICKKP